MPTTSNFGWTTPADTDLVKDGAAAIRTLGNGIDTSFLDLKGGTTGQILSKASNTDLDFTWSAGGDITEVQAGTGISVASGTGPIPVVTNTVATAFDAKGDLIVGTGADTFSRLAVGTNDYVLTAASGEATGLKWAAPASGSTFAGCSLTKSAAQTISNATTVSITFDTEEFDTDAYHSTSSNTSRITIPSGKGGKYLFVMTANFAGNTTGQRLLMLYKNGAVHKYSTSLGGTSFSFRATTSVIVNAVATDYFEFAVYQDSGGSLDINGSATDTTFATTYLGA